MYFVLQNDKGLVANVIDQNYCSKHSHAEQYCVLTLSPQQSPPSYSHPG